MNEVKKAVKNKRTGTVHMGTIHGETREVLRVSCGKPIHDDYEEAEIFDKLTCAVCRTKIAGRATGYKYKRYRYR